MAGSSIGSEHPRAILQALALPAPPPANCCQSLSVLAFKSLPKRNPQGFWAGTDPRRTLPSDLATMPRRLPVRAPLALALALAAAAGVDASFAPLADCRFFYHVGLSEKPPLCQVSKDGKFLTLTSAPPGADALPKSTSAILEYEVNKLKKNEVKDGIRDLIVYAFVGDLGEPKREIDKSYGFNKFSKRWSKMRKKGPTKAVPALVGLGTADDFEIKLDKVKFLKH